jgi:hypothetical protein
VCDLDVMGTPSKLSVIRKVATLARVVQTNPRFDLRGERRAAEVELVTVMLRKVTS